MSEDSSNPSLEDGRSKDGTFEHENDTFTSVPCPFLTLLGGTNKNR